MGDPISQWLTRRTTIADVENGFAADPPLPWWKRALGFRRSGVCDDWLTAWNRFKGTLHDGDEVWEFCSPSETWENLQGRAGYAIVRNSRVVSYIVVLEN
jgi:hypothetical protein